MIRVKVIKSIKRADNRRKYEIGDELFVHDIEGISSWESEYMYRYKRNGSKQIYIDRIPKECVEVTESKEEL
jgi:hypothetical protein